MSEQDAQFLAEQWEEFARASPLESEEFSRLVERWWHPEITYEEDPRWPGSGTYSGRDQVKGVFEGYREVLGSPVTRVEKVIEADGSFVVLIRFAGSSPGSEVPWEHVWGYVCRLREGKLVYLRAYWDPDEALAAAGVSSP